MRRDAGRTAGLLLGLAVLAGCEKEKTAPTAVTLSTNRDTAPAVVVPAKSDPEAVKVVERCIKYTTGGHPERLEKARANRVAKKGTVVHNPQSPIAVPTTQRTEAVWPDRAATTTEYDSDGPLVLTVGLRRPVLWARTNRGGAIDPQREESVVAGDLMGRHWMALLLPLTDPATVVFEPRKQTVGGQDADVIRAAVKGSPVYTLWFDAKAGYLGRVDFLQVERAGGAVVSKSFALMNQKEFSGLMLPARVTYAQDGPVVEDWAVESWEFPDKIDPAVFDQPK